ILIANRDANSSIAKLNKKRGWWTPPLFTASIAYAKYFFRHTLRQNTITQARRNISQHYDLSNELFSLFLDDTMTYSCAIFKTEDEDLRVAQLRKISLLIEKARIDKNHHVLDIECGWGSLAIELVKQTGCHCTAITLSKEQLKYAEQKVIVLGLQFISMPDDRYDEHRLSSDFVREYIFPGGCLPSLSRILELGFDESFIRTWEYYFDYCAAGFKSRIIGDYQIVFSRAGNVTTFNNPYKGISSANSLS
uniref:Cyclopropane-fatty-acyl-phospholipid synthase n=1 Tax=Cucumis melo TaxID=3656 RepID=A0A9I9DSB9_CUCME